MSAKPITPKEAAEQKVASIPEAVIEAFNELIAKEFRAGTATVLQGDVVQLASSKMGVSPANFDYDDLNVEPMYRKAGWKVEYDKPGFNETYPATFKFTKR